MQLITLAMRQLNGAKSQISRKQAIQSLDYLESALGHIRTIINNINPSHLKDIGISAALRCMVNRLNQHEGVSIQHQVAEIQGLTQEQELALYRIAQEALNNALKYAGPSPIHCIFMKQDKQVILQIEDEGPGFDPSTRQRHTQFGLYSMQGTRRVARSRSSDRYRIERRNDDFAQTRARSQANKTVVG